ncbi:MAG: hypothetical protein AABX07_02740 [Nanoarchaeota archaeon]
MEQKQISIEQVYQKLVLMEKFMKKMNQYIDDLEFARRTSEAWQEIETGKGKTYSVEEFKKKLNG